MMKRYGVGVFGLFVGSLVAGACSSDNAATPADAGGTDSGSDVYVPPGCNTPDEPSKNTASCLVDAYGIFLKPTGNDVTGTGTKDNPLRTLGAAAAKLKGKAGRIVACAGSYEGAGTEITSAISIYGGFSCADWTYATTNETVFTTDAQKADVVLTLRSVTGVNVQDATFRARPGAVGGGSSIAVFVASSQAVKFLRAKLEADVGGDATNGTTQTMTLPDNLALRGNAADDKGNGSALDDTGGAEKAMTCPGGKVTAGGKGGDFGLPGANAKPAPPIGGAGGLVSDCSGGTRNGTDGATGQNGAAPLAAGSLTPTGWKAAAGNPGLVGEPGGGGGGGYGGGGGGGSGGAGGCGGGPGTGGSAGGSSIALASVDSDVSLADSAVAAKAAKRGGDGGAGQPARDEDFGAGGNRSGIACNGGNGGKGGAGGAGSGGAGGISVGVVYTKRKPTTERTQVTFGTLGAAGGGPGNPGVSGAAQDFLEVPGS